jgi:HEAT repeat protein
MAFALVSSNHDDYVNELTNALNSRLSAQAEMYIYELGKYRGKVALLNGYLRSSDPKVRAGMARIMGRIGDPSSRAPLDELTKDPNTDVMREAVNALRQLNTNDGLAFGYALLHYDPGFFKLAALKHALSAGSSLKEVPASRI